MVTICLTCETDTSASRLDEISREYSLGQDSQELRHHGTAIISGVEVRLVCAIDGCKRPVGLVRNNVTLLVWPDFSFKQQTRTEIPQKNTSDSNKFIAGATTKLKVAYLNCWHFSRMAASETSDLSVPWISTWRPWRAFFKESLVPA